MSWRSDDGHPPLGAARRIPHPLPPPGRQAGVQAVIGAATSGPHPSNGVSTLPTYLTVSYLQPSALSSMRCAVAHLGSHSSTCSFRGLAGARFWRSARVAARCSAAMGAWSLDPDAAANTCRAGAPDILRAGYAEVFVRRARGGAAVPPCAPAWKFCASVQALACDDDGDDDNDDGNDPIP